MFFRKRHHSAERFAAACVIFFVLLAPRTALALASDWTEASHAQLRLIADSGAHGPRAGIEILLESGWKTYWRYPGDSGMPPRFDWSGSENLASAEVQWPAPDLFTDESGSKSIGYHDRVVFPVAIKPADPALPVKLHLKVDFAVCDKLCVPASAEATLEIPPEPGDFSEILEQAVSKVPRRATLGSGGALSVTGIRIEHGAKPRAIISVSAPQGTTPILLAEGPDERWALPIPQKLDEADGIVRFALPFEGAPPGAKPIPSKLVVTLVVTDDAIEVDIPLQ